MSASTAARRAAFTCRPRGGTQTHTSAPAACAEVSRPFAAPSNDRRGQRGEERGWAEARLVLREEHRGGEVQARRVKVDAPEGRAAQLACVMRQATVKGVRGARPDSSRHPKAERVAQPHRRPP